MMDRERRGSANSSPLSRGKSRTRDPECGDRHDHQIFVDLYIPGTQLAIHERRGGSSGGSKVIYTMRAQLIFAGNRRRARACQRF